MISIGAMADPTSLMLDDMIAVVDEGFSDGVTFIPRTGLEDEYARQRSMTGWFHRAVVRSLPFV